MKKVFVVIVFLFIVFFTTNTNTSAKQLISSIDGLGDAKFGMNIRQFDQTDAHKNGIYMFGKYRQTNEVFAQMGFTGDGFYANDLNMMIIDVSDVGFEKTLNFLQKKYKFYRKSSDLIVEHFNKRTRNGQGGYAFLRIRYTFCQGQIVLIHRFEHSGQIFTEVIYLGKEKAEWHNDLMDKMEANSKDPEWYK